jgi:hypothetical protein
MANQENQSDSNPEISIDEIDKFLAEEEEKVKEKPAAEKPVLPQEVGESEAKNYSDRPVETPPETAFTKPSMDYDAYQQKVRETAGKIDVSEEELLAFQESILLRQKPYELTVTANPSKIEFKVRVATAYEYNLVWAYCLSEQNKKLYPDYRSLLAGMQQHYIALQLLSIQGKPSGGGKSLDPTLTTEANFTELEKMYNVTVGNYPAPLVSLLIDAFTFAEAKIYKMYTLLKNSDFS